MSTQTGAGAGVQRRRSWLGLLAPAMIAFAILIALGTWQIQRKAWKEGLIALLTEQLAAAPTALPPPATWPGLDQTDNEYRRVKFSATFDNDNEALVYGAASSFRPDVSGPGYWVFTPARLAGGSLLIVNRGFVPEGRRDPKSRPDGLVSGTTEIIGVIRWPDAQHWFMPNEDLAHNLWFSRDPQSIATAKRLGTVAPFYIEQETPAPPGGLPQPGKIVVKLSNNHLQYAVTWFGLAIVLVVVFVTWAFNSRRDTGRESPSPRPQSPSRSL